MVFEIYEERTGDKKHKVRMSLITPIKKISLTTLKNTFASKRHS